MLTYFSGFFYKPKEYDKVVNTIKKEGFVLLFGKPGSGKTTMANYLAKTEFSEYKTTYLKPKETKATKENKDKTLVLWDDCFGTWNTTSTISNQVFGTLKQLIQQTKEISDKMNAIVCIDSSSVEENQLNQWKDCLVNTDKFYDTQLDKEKFRNASHLDNTIRTVSTDVGFPLLIHLVKIGFCTQESTSKFLGEPVAYIHDDIDSILFEQSDDYVTLVYAISNSSTIDLKKINRKLMGEIQRECHRIVHRETDDAHPADDSEAGENTTDGTCENPDHNGNINDDSKGRKRDEGGFIESSSGNIKLNDGTSSVDKEKENAKGKEKSNSAKHMKIDITENLLRYLVESDKSSEYKFRHQFLAECILRYHIKHVGRETVLMKGPDEIRMVVEHIQPTVHPNLSEVIK